MTFTREELASYEAKPATAAVETNATPASEETPATDPEGGTSQESTEATSTSIDADPADPDTTDGSTPATEDSGTSPATAEGETDPDADPEAAPQPAPKKGSAAARIAELIDENKALRGFGNHVTEQITALKEQLEKLNGGKGPTQAQAEAIATAAPTDDPMPTLEDTGYDSAEHTKKLAAWTQRQIQRGVKDAVQTIKREQTDEAIKATYLNRAAMFARKKADYEVVMSNKNLPQQQQVVSREVVMSENGPAIAYHLAKNPDLAVRISKMNTAQALVAIGRIDATIEAEKKAPPAGDKKPTTQKTAAKSGNRTVSNAPPPPKSTGTGADTRTRPSTDTSMNMDDWVSAERNRKIQERTNRQKQRMSFR